MVLTFGTGIGGCLIVDGKPYKGTHLFAGEVSVFLTKPIKQHGMEALWGPQGSFAKLVSRICDEKQIELVDGQTAMQWIEDKDEVAYPMFQTYCEAIAQQLFNFQILLDPQRICIGGGISANPYYLHALQEAMEDLYHQLPFAIPALELVSCKFHNDSNLIGALYHFKQMQEK